MARKQTPRRLFDGALLERHRKRLGLSQLEFSRRTGATASCLCHIEKGNGVPSLVLFREILKSLDLGMVEAFELIRLTPPGVSYAEFRKFLAACRQEQIPPAKVLADFIRAYAES